VFGLILEENRELEYVLVGLISVVLAKHTTQKGTITTLYPASVTDGFL
jgi:hypothetical protein